MYLQTKTPIDLKKTIALCESIWYSRSFFFEAGWFFVNFCSCVIYIKNPCNLHAFSKVRLKII